MTFLESFQLRPGLGPWGTYQHLGLAVEFRGVSSVRRQLLTIEMNVVFDLPLLGAMSEDFLDIFERKSANTRFWDSASHQMHPCSSWVVELRQNRPDLLCCDIRIPRSH
jgi:hypothetical protein